MVRDWFAFRRDAEMDRSLGSWGEDRRWVAAMLVREERWIVERTKVDASRGRESGDWLMRKPCSRCLINFIL